MNVFLKALVLELWDLEQAGESASHKQWSALVSAGIKCGMDLPALISAAGGASAELSALVSNPAADADLIAYVVGLVGNDSKAAHVVSASADLVLSVLQLEPKLEALIAAVKA